MAHLRYVLLKMLTASSEEALVLKEDALSLSKGLKPVLIPVLVPEFFGKLRTSTVNTTLSSVCYLNWI